jgi:hypothetical protein
MAIITENKIQMEVLRFGSGPSSKQVEIKIDDAFNFSNAEGNCSIVEALNKVASSGTDDAKSFKGAMATA